MLPRRIYPRIVALILFSSCAMELYAQGVWDGVPGIAPSGTIQADGTDVTPVLGSPPPNLEFGGALALHGHKVAAGMAAFGDHVGRVAIFVRDSSGDWIRNGTLDPSDGQPGDFFGERLALWGDEALVASQQGVYVFHQFGSHWQQVQKLPPTAEIPLSGDLALGEHWAFIGNSVPGKPGEVRVYEIGRHGRLREVKVLDSQKGVPDDGFGTHIAFSHGTLLVGAPQDNSGQGAAYVFENHGPHWLRRQNLIALDGGPGQLFGASVAIDDGLIAIGATGAARDPDQFDCEVGYSGAVYVFEPHRGLWFEQQRLLGPPKCTAAFGDQVAISHGFLVTRTPSLFPVYIGSTFIYRRQGRQFVPSALGQNSDRFGGPIALSNSTLFTGQPSDGGFNTGFAYFYDLSELPAP